MEEFKDLKTYSDIHSPEDEIIQTWRFKKLLKSLGEMSGSGTSMVTMFVPCKPDALNKANKKLSDEASSASNIKSQSNKKSVMDAITSIGEKLKLYKEVPKNGLIILCGTVDQDGKDAGRKFTIDFEPYKPITA